MNKKSDYIEINPVKIPLEAEELVLSVLRSGRISQGKTVEELEVEFAKFIGVKHAIAVNNGTSALIAALRSLQLDQNDEIITSPFTFVATLNAILKSGASVRFADISERDFSIDPKEVEKNITARTQVIMPVHLFGQSSDMKPITELAKNNSLTIVEDAAQAHGASYFEKQVGTWGIGCFSLYASKNITAGEGGIVTTNCDQIAEYIRLFRNQGMNKKYEYKIIGENLRLTDIQAALCLPQLTNYPDLLATRRDNANYLTEGLKNIENIKLPEEITGRRHVWHQYTILVKERAGLDRNELARSLLEAKIKTGIYYPKTVFDYDCFDNNPQILKSNVPVATSISKQCISLPVHPFLTESELEKIVSTVRSIFKNYSHTY